MTPITSVRFPNCSDREPKFHSNTGRMWPILPRRQSICFAHGSLLQCAESRDIALQLRNCRKQLQLLLKAR